MGLIWGRCVKSRTLRRLEDEFDESRRAAHQRRCREGRCQKRVHVDLLGLRQKLCNLGAHFVVCEGLFLMGHVVLSTRHKIALRQHFIKVAEIGLTAAAIDPATPRGNTLRMLAIFVQTLPFFALIAVGYGAGKTGFFTEEATAYLTKFVFYFALSAMLFRFSANLSLAEIFDWRIAAGYLWGTAFVYGVGMAVAFLRGMDTAAAGFEGQVAAIGNTGFLGVPMLALLMGQDAVGPIILVLTIDLVVFSSLIVILVVGSREGALSWGIFKTVGLGLLKNPMIVSIVLGFVVSTSGIPLPKPVNDFFGILGAAATPGALFAIGASLATKSAERLTVAGWLSFCKLVIHPLAVAVGVYFLFPADPYKAGVVVAAAALPVAGNVFILAQHYGVAPQRVSAAILISTAVSIFTVSFVISQVLV